MRNVLTIAGKELRSYFSSPVAYVLIASYLALGGYFFNALLTAFNQTLTIYSMMRNPEMLARFNLNQMVVVPLLHNMSVLLIFIVPAITMRMFPEEKRAGTYELLLTSPVRVGEIVFGAHDLGQIGVTLIVLLCIWLFFRFTPLGLAMRAAAQNPISSRLVGIRVGWMLALGWGLASAIGAIAGMMVAPTVFLEPNMMGGVLLYAFAGALLGGIDSPGGAVLGGFIVGVLENVVGTYVGSELKLTLALVVIIGVLVVKPSGLFGKVHVVRV